MDNFVAFIPVRGGSKSIPLKNIREIAGKPLVYWAINACVKSDFIAKIYVMTDSPLIKQCVENFNMPKVTVIGRSPESASDTASTEYALLEFANAYEFNNIVFIQATSPLITAEDIDGGIALYNTPQVDSVLSVVEQKRFIWNYKDATHTIVNPLNYDHHNRPRRQEFDGFLVENGAFYITSKKRLLESKNRLSGNIAAYKMREDTFFEIDEPSDWLIVSHLLKARTDTLPYNLPDIKLFLTDCDGCLTDGGMYYSEKGDELKKFNTRDGVGFALLQQKGILTGILTSEDVDLNRRRAKRLKLDILRSGCTDKATALKKICETYHIDLKNVCYIGDDINDVEVLKSVGFGCAPANATTPAKKAAKYIAETKGGDGVIREIADLICRRG